MLHIDEVAKLLVPRACFVHEEVLDTALVRMNDDIVGSVEDLPFPLVRQHGDFTVVFIANHAAVAVLAR